MFGQWHDTIRSRFGNREKLEPQAAYEAFWSEFPQQAVMELFQLIEIEYQLSPGLLRPNDTVNKLLESIKPVNFLKWLFYQAHTEDSESELRYQLGKREQQHGTQDAWERAKIRTIEDLMRAWSGQLPKDKPRT
ncbi:protein of unknown function [Nitrospira defluvii]|jgi:hypothetical protein|uniref:Uncharacterized protein n=1 Tax=Nitrospira defluvii TaxID=330214 RepID=D8PCR3_9BACT|nr:protein of unknown function [Nitrospira defluvii]